MAFIFNPMALPLINVQKKNKGKGKNSVYMGVFGSRF